VAEDYEAKGEWIEAARIFKYLQDHYDNEVWMQTRWANALYQSGRYQASIDILKDIFAKRPTVATYLLKARSHKRLEQFHQAIACLEQAETILDGRELSWT
jgi:tetratricopeptide (TPR) repeat protein